MGEWRLASGAYVRRVERDGSILETQVFKGVLAWWFAVDEIAIAVDGKVREVLPSEQVDSAEAGMARADAWLLEVHGG